MRIWEDYVAHEFSDEALHGSLKVLRELASPQLGNVRDLFVYRPPSYESSDRRYPVIYMHDGQNLFDPRTSFAGEWNVDGILDEASSEGLEAIVVGIPNMGTARCSEYSPFDDPRHGPGNGDAYIAFITDTIKPLIDHDYRTLPEREQTGIAGSSLGGLISVYAFFKRPDIFGFTGVMSPALWYGKRKIYDYLDTVTHVGGRVYLDVGTREGSRELHDVLDLRDRLVRMGYRSGEDLLYVVDRGGAHNEAAWARRLGKQLRFLLGGAPVGGR